MRLVLIADTRSEHDRLDVLQPTMPGARRSRYAKVCAHCTDRPSRALILFVLPLLSACSLWTGVREVPLDLPSAPALLPPDAPTPPVRLTILGPTPYADDARAAFRAALPTPEPGARPLHLLLVIERLRQIGPTDDEPGHNQRNPEPRATCQLALRAIDGPPDRLWRQRDSAPLADDASRTLVRELATRLARRLRRPETTSTTLLDDDSAPTRRAIAHARDGRLSDALTLCRLAARNAPDDRARYVAHYNAAQLLPPDQGRAELTRARDTAPTDRDRARAQQALDSLVTDDDHHPLTLIADDNHPLSRLLAAAPGQARHASDPTLLATQSTTTGTLPNHQRWQTATFTLRNDRWTERLDLTTVCAADTDPIDALRALLPGTPPIPSIDR